MNFFMRIVCWWAGHAPPVTYGGRRIDPVFVCPRCHHKWVLDDETFDPLEPRP